MIFVAEQAASLPSVNRTELETKVKEMYRLVALSPQGDFHFEMGRSRSDRVVRWGRLLFSSSPTQGGRASAGSRQWVGHGYFHYGPERWAHAVGWLVWI
jgi:hypothetical protein